MRIKLGPAPPQTTATTNTGCLEKQPEPPRDRFGKKSEVRRLGKRGWRARREREEDVPKLKVTEQKNKAKHDPTHTHTHTHTPERKQKQKRGMRRTVEMESKKSRPNFNCFIIRGLREVKRREEGVWTPS